MDGHRIKQTGKRFLIDGASVVIFAAITIVFGQGFGILYAAIYNTQKMPTPEVFSSVVQTFAGAISLVYLLLLTRKHQNPQETSKVDQQ